MKKFVAALTALFTFFSSASVLAEEHVVYCPKGQDCHVTLDLRPSPPAPPLLPTPANTPAPADNSWIGWTIGSVVAAAAVVVGSVLIAKAIRDRDDQPDGEPEKHDIIVDVEFKNPPETQPGS